MTALSEFPDPDGPEAFEGTLMDGLEKEPPYYAVEYLRLRASLIRRRIAYLDAVLSDVRQFLERWTAE